MDRPRTPRSGLAASRSTRSSHSSASTSKKRRQQSDSPHTADDQARARPMGGLVQDSGAGTISDNPARGPCSEFPAPASGAGKSSKAAKRKKNRHRKRRNRHQSFFTPAREASHERSGTAAGAGGGTRDPMEADRPPSRDNPPFYTLGRDLSSTSLDSDALLDHRYVDVFVGFIEE